MFPIVITAATGAPIPVDPTAAVAAQAAPRLAATWASAFPNAALPTFVWLGLHFECFKPQPDAASLSRK